MTAAERKQQSIDFLKSRDIPYIEHLPRVEEENEAQIRTAQEIAKRIIVLTYLCYVAEVQEAKNDVIDFLKSDNIWESVTEEENVLFNKEELTDREKIDISWRTEAIWLLLWSIKKVNKLDFPDHEANVPDILERMPQLLVSTKDFVEAATIRATNEILDVLDLTLRLHWACRQAQLTGKQIPNIHPSVVVERHYALNWVTYYADNWEDITTDT